MPIVTIIFTSLFAISTCVFFIILTPEVIRLTRETIQADQINQVDEMFEVVF